MCSTKAGTLKLLEQFILQLISYIKISHWQNCPFISWWKFLCGEPTYNFKICKTFLSEIHDWRKLFFLKNTTDALFLFKVRRKSLLITTMITLNNLLSDWKKNELSVRRRKNHHIKKSFLKILYYVNKHRFTGQQQVLLDLFLRNSD